MNRKHIYSVRELSTGVETLRGAKRKTNIKFFVALTLLSILSFLPIAQALGSGSVYGTVRDESGTPIVNVKVVLSFKVNQTSINTTYTDTNGKYLFSNLSADNYTLQLSAIGYQDQTVDVSLGSGEKYELNVTLKKVSAGKQPPSGGGADYTIIGAVIFLFPLLFVLAVGLITFVLYSKLKRDRILSHEVRNRIYTFIKENPGSHYRGMLEALNLKMGVLTHHLHTLEREEFIRSVENGIYRKYYPAGTVIEILPPLSIAQQKILQIIRENPGISQSEIATALSTRRMFVNYHVKRLREYGLITVQVNGRASSCYCREYASS